MQPILFRALPDPQAALPSIETDDPGSGAELGEVLLHLYACALVMLGVAALLLS